MPNGHINDPRMNTIEKEFGILVSSEKNENGSCKQYYYLKDEVSRFLTFGTPVTFDIQIRKVTYDDTRECENCPSIEVATNVRVDREKIKSHKVINKLNLFAEFIMSLDDDKVDEMLRRCDSTIQQHRQIKKSI